MSGTSPESRRRKQILRAAEKLFQHYGFGKTTVADIAREAGVGVGTMYLEFASKEDIVAELSAQRLQCVLDAMRKAAEAPGPYAERLISMVEARLKWFAQFARQGQHGMDLVRCACPATEDAHQRFRQEEHTLLTALLDQAARAGELEVADPAQTARVLLRLYESYTPAVATELGPRQTRREIACAHTLMLRGLLPRRR